MTLEQIKQAISEGKRVYWQNKASSRIQSRSLGVRVWVGFIFGTS